MQVKQEKLYQFSWRPRPKDLLSAEDKKKVVKRLPHYIKIFDSEDKKRKSVRLSMQLLCMYVCMHIRMYVCVN